MMESDPTLAFDLGKIVGINALDRIIFRDIRKSRPAAFWASARTEPTATTAE
jgi:hypothetical protein